jgi:hypothetical protein
MSVEDYSDQFYGEQIRHLEATRGIRASAWQDQKLSDTQRMVLGITGSRDISDGYEALIDRLGGLMGQPIISIDSRRENEYDRRPLIEKGRGGIISGEAQLISSGFTKEAETEFGRVGATLRLEVPVEPIVIYANGVIMDKMAIFTGKQVNGNTILIASVANTERSNGTTNPHRDYRETYPHDNYDSTPILLGRRAIHQASQAFDGLLEVLDAIDGLASN